MIKLGVTGGLAAGKSTACSYLQKRGALVFDADQVAKNILFKTPSIWPDLEDKLSTNLINADGLDKNRLAQIAFSSKENQQALNKIIHPHVKEKFIEFVNKKKGRTKLIVADVALLFESKFEEHLDYTLVIHCDPETRIQRAQERGNLTPEQIKKRMQLQMPEEEKLKRASFIIENNGTQQEFSREINKLYNNLLNIEQ